jgi:hypothetical protein
MAVMLAGSVFTSSLRKQEPITTGLRWRGSNYPWRQNEKTRRMGPRVRGDDGK